MNVTPLQESLGSMSIEEINMIKSIRENNKNTWYRYGKSLEISLSIEESNCCPIMNKGQSIVLKYMIAIELFITKEEINKDLVQLIKMKKSKYREALIEYEIWTEEIYLKIRNKVMNIKELKC